MKHTAAVRTGEIAYMTDAATYVAKHPAYHLAVLYSWTCCELRGACLTLTAENAGKHPLATLIEREWHGIVKAAGLCGASGYRLRSAHVLREGDRAILTLRGWAASAAVVGFDASKTWAEDKLRTGTVVFEGVQDGDLPAEDYDLTLA